MKIKQKRQLLGYSRKQLAAKVGISVHYLIKLENGQRTHPNVDILRALAYELNTSMQELLSE